MADANVLPLPEPPAEERPVLVVDFGGQYSQLIARRVRECRVYSELVRHDTPAQALRARHPRALILSGGPASVYAEGAPSVDPAIFELLLERIGRAPAECIYIDDNARNVASAAALGFDAIAFEDVPRLRDKLRRRGLPTGRRERA